MGGDRAAGGSGCATRPYPVKPKASVAVASITRRRVGSWKLYQHQGLGKGEIGRAESIDIVAVVRHAIKL